MPETKDLSLEQLAEVFAISSKRHALHGLEEAVYFVRKYVLRRKRVTRPVLFQKEELEEETIEMY